MMTRTEYNETFERIHYAYRQGYITAEAVDALVEELDFEWMNSRECEYAPDFRTF